MKLSLTNERINAQGGLNLTGSILSYYTPLPSLFAQRLPVRSDKISEVDILITQIGLLRLSRTHYKDVELYRQDEAEGFSLSLGIDRIPSNKHEVNKLFFALGAIAYNLLRAVDNRLAQHKNKWPSHLKKRIKQKRRRLGSILKDIICIAGKLVSHSGIKQMKI